MSSSTPGTHRLVDASSAEEAQAMIDVTTGSRTALARLYDLTAARIFGMILDVLPDRVAAEVVLQETYVRVWARAGEFSSDAGTPTAWMARIALRRALDHPGASRSTEVEDRSGVAGTRILHVLPRDERECIALAQHAGLSVAQIAAHTGRTVASVRALTRSAMTRLHAGTGHAEAEVAVPETAEPEAAVLGAEAPAVVAVMTAPAVAAVAASALHATMPTGATPTQTPA